MYYSQGLQIKDFDSMEDTEKNENEQEGSGRKVGRPPKIKDTLEVYAEEESPTTNMRGRPKGSRNVPVLPADLKDSKTRSACPFVAAPTPTRPPSSASAPPTSSKPGTSSRPRLYLLENELAGPLISSKLPKNKNILRRFLDLYGEKEERIRTSNDK